eukprot:CAMPEP_0180703048 /NCGR_PEP_ID=MMETSP1038_2-20121128/6430_1 /TAXON_ID=632150 /ORGANISM="Azadinium spinosum, Strain 3D9" /LENGTH=147 /DNA_ID=CAMNT_0022734819 /DNA_START=188 /DNA_END=628 /DNA_ORIENTATION=+
MKPSSPKRLTISRKSNASKPLFTNISPRPVLKSTRLVNTPPILPIKLWTCTWHASQPIPSTRTAIVSAPAAKGAQEAPPNRINASGRKVKDKHNRVCTASRVTVGRHQHRRRQRPHDAISQAPVRSRNCCRRGPNTLLKPAQPTWAT